MPGSASFDPSGGVPLLRRPIAILVYSYDDIDRTLTLRPNIRCTRVIRRAGPDPGLAEFRYVFDGMGAVDVNFEWPTTPEQVIGAEATGPYVAKTDDRLVVYGVTDSGKRRILFDGFVQTPAGTLTSDKGSAAFVATGTPIREWDTPLWPMLYRDADSPDDSEANKEVHLEGRFNPEGQGNATPEGADVREGEDDAHPALMDAATCRQLGIGRKWTLSMAVRHVLYRGNAQEVYTDLPTAALVDEILDARKPTEGWWLDPSDPSTYTSEPITIRPFDFTGQAWPVALQKLIQPHGFFFRWDLGQDEDDFPTWKLVLFRIDDADPDVEKEVGLQPPGEIVDPAKTAVARLQLTRDNGDIANEIVVETRRVQYEVCCVLAPGFTPDPADVASEAAKKPCLRGTGTAPQTSADAAKYRLWVLDEDGAGHWDGFVFVTDQPTSMKKILGGEDEDESLYVVRRRPGKKALFTTDDLGNARQAILELSTDYAGPSPGPWDGTGTWYPIPNGWQLYQTAFGITLEINNPDAWDSGNKSIAFGVNAKTVSGTIRAMSATAKAGETRFKLKLTAVIEGDRVFEAKAEKRDASPTAFRVMRYIDGRDRYQYNVIHSTSALRSDHETSEIKRDDSDDASYEAIARRAANETPPLAGPLTIPKIVNTWKLGDRITKIAGREMSLQTNIGNEAGEGKRYPAVVGIEYKLDSRQETILHLSDDRGEGKF